MSRRLKRHPPIRRTTRLKVIGLDETAILKEALLFYERELKADVKVYSEEDGGKDDPKGRAALAQPFRPAIYLE
ncbi:MAG: hypothetical protein GTO54_07000 [Nitrososphaeria archaeon]|nr:hypothetical protein [Nitrososphaeria archaeon]